MENDGREQRDVDNFEIDKRVSAALAPARGASARVVANALGASVGLSVRARRMRPWKVIAVGATGLALAVLVAALAWPPKSAPPALVIIAGQSPSSGHVGSYVMVVPVQKEGK